MWTTKDGRVHTVALPSDQIDRFEELLAALATLDREELRLLDDALEAEMWEIAEAPDEVGFDPEVEATFENSVPPTELLRDINWERLVGPGLTEAVSEINLRWRLDIVAIVQQAIADHPPP